MNCQSWPNRSSLRSALFENIEVFYIRQRRHSTLGYLSPHEYEMINIKSGAT